MTTISMLPLILLLLRCLDFFVVCLVQAASSVCLEHRLMLSRKDWDAHTSPSPP